MKKYKKKYINLRWLNLEIVQKAKWLFEVFNFRYVDNRTLILYSTFRKKFLPKVIIIIKRSSKNVYKVTYCSKTVKTVSVNKASKVIEYIKNTYYEEITIINE